MYDGLEHRPASWKVYLRKYLAFITRATKESSYINKTPPLLSQNGLVKTHQITETKPTKLVGMAQATRPHSLNRPLMIRWSPLKFYKPLNCLDYRPTLNKVLSTRTVNVFTPSAAECPLLVICDIQIVSLIVVRVEKKKKIDCSCKLTWWRFPVPNNLVSFTTHCVLIT